MSLQNPLDTELARRGGVNGLITQIKKVLTFYFPKPTGKSTDYIRGDGSIAPFPTVSGSTYNPTAGTGISITGTSPNQTITNTLPDQTVALTAGTGIGISGTYPNFTITNSSPSSGGTVTSVGLTTGTTGTDVNVSGSPVTGSGSITLNIPTASATNRGVLSSADWTTFNNKGNGTVTSVSALTLGTTGTDLSSTVANGTTTPVITLNVPTASATNRGALSSTDWSTFNNKQNALVSGTNIRTINGNSLLGSGNLTISASPSGLSGEIQFNNAGSFGSDSNLFWDNTNKRLGIGTSTPNSILQSISGICDFRFSTGSGSATPTISTINTSSTGKAVALAAGTNGSAFAFDQSGYFAIVGEAKSAFTGNNVGNGTIRMVVQGSNGNVGIGTGVSAAARLDVRAQGSLSTDIAFRVRNSADTADIMSVQGNTVINLLPTNIGNTFLNIRSNINPTISITDANGTGAIIAHRYQFNPGGASNLLSQSLNLVTNGVGGGQLGVAKINNIMSTLNWSTSTQAQREGGFYIYFTATNNFEGITSSNRAFWITPNRRSFFYNQNGSIVVGDTDAFSLYADDIIAGNSAPHFRTENGSVIKLYQETTAIGGATFVANTGTTVNSASTFDGYTIGQIVKALRTQGLLA